MFILSLGYGWKIEISNYIFVGVNLIFFLNLVRECYWFIENSWEVGRGRREGEGRVW